MNDLDSGVDYFDLNTADYHRGHGVEPDVTAHGSWVLVRDTARSGGPAMTVEMTGTLEQIAETLEAEHGNGVWNVQP